MPQKLTQDLVEALRPTGRDLVIFDSLVSGFAVRVTPAGAKLFIVQAWAGGRKRRLKVGAFPGMTVADARRDARGVLHDLRAGRDPVAEKAVRQQALEAGQVTVADLADRWLREYVHPKLKPRTAADYVKLVEQRITPEFGHLAVGQVTKDHVIAVHAKMARTPRRANYTAATFRALMTFAEDVGLRPPMSNPVRRLRMYREGKRERFLSETEIAAAVDAIATAEQKGKIGPHAAAGLRLCLFTGARSGEITATKWEHVNFSRRLIRLPDSKTNEPRTVHLSDAAVEILKTLPRVGPFVVAGAKTGEPYKNLSRAWIIARAYAGLDDVRLHDLRHSFASLAAGRGVSLLMIGKLLGHRSERTTLRYAHLARDAEAAVNDELGAVMAAAIERGQPASADVVRLPKRKGRKRANV